MEKKANHFSGQIGFVLAAAGSAVGVGNLWRFPYLAAKDGGGLFLIVYLALVLTFGFTLLTSDIAIGRCGGGGQLLYRLYLLPGGPGGICPAVYGNHRFHCVPGNPGRH